MVQPKFNQARAHPGTGASRRQVVGSFVGTAAALLAGGLAVARKGGNGKSKGKGHAKAKGKGKTKVSFCHRDEDTASFHLITVAEPARKAHEKHGDVECTEGPCASFDEPCTVVCTADGACVASGSEVEEPVEE
jgi:hypothetical protein